MFMKYYLGSFFMFLFSLVFFMVGFYFLVVDWLIFLDWDIISVNGCMVSMSLVLDYMSMIFMGCVCMISSMVILYSESYMKTDVNSYRFLVLVSLFIMSMVLMILSPNLISILLGWDGLGLVSYCLVIFFQNSKSYNSGMLTIVTNRVGDVAILICIVWMLNFGGWNFFLTFWFLDNLVIYNIYILVVLASFTKSAQIPFSSWLPAAMAAPTPVSSLVHSSTLVTAGVYLMIRFSPMLGMFDCSILISLSAMTMFMSGLGANFEFDLKKVIALSTLSQLGLMMMVLFAGFPELAFFHLLSHAFFSALLFLCSGLIIHVMSNSQDIREMGFVGQSLPYTSSCFIISSFSLAGVPFMSGFYSKDMIIEWMFFQNFNFWNYFILMLSVGLTMSYSFRLFFYLMFWGSGNYCYQSYFEDTNMMLSMIFLSLASMVFGVSLLWVMFSTPFFSVSLFSIKLMPIFMVLLGMVMGIMFSVFCPKMSGLLKNSVLFFLGSMWGMPMYSTYMIYPISFGLAKFYYKNMDSGWGEFFFSKSYSSFLYFLSKLNYILESNHIKLFLLSFFFLILIFVI